MLSKIFNTFLFIVFFHSLLAQRIPESYQTPFSTYPVKAGACAQVTHSSGSQIFIEEGTISAGLDSVVIYYREMRTPMDMLVHDIHMYTWLGEKIYLESTGMFEIYALAGSDTIEMAPGKIIEVRMTTSAKRADPMVEGYIYDRKKHLWENYTNQISILKIDDDNHLWGSPPVKNAQTDDSGGNKQESRDKKSQDNWSSAGPNIQSQTVLQTMSIDQFGLFNFDKMLGGFNYVYLQPSFVDNNGEKISSTIFVVYKNINSIFYFPAEGNGDFFIIQNQPYKLLTISDNGSIAILEKYPNLSQIKNQVITFELQNSGQPENRQQLTKITGIP
ncbi:MAG: hypothetical protein ACOCXH_16340 [Cyclobacteriaceae bacterium]